MCVAFYKLDCDYYDYYNTCIVKQKLTFAGCVMRGFSGTSVLLVLEGKFDWKKMRGLPN